MICVRPHLGAGLIGLEKVWEDHPGRGFLATAYNNCGDNSKRLGVIACYKSRCKAALEGCTLKKN